MLNIPNITGCSFHAFCCYPRGVLPYPADFWCPLYNTPQITLRAGSVVSASISTTTFNTTGNGHVVVSVGVDQWGDLSWGVRMYGGCYNSCTGEFTLTVATSSVPERGLEGGTFTWPIRFVLHGQDWPDSGAATLLEFTEGERVDHSFSTNYTQAWVYDDESAGWGCFPGKLVSIDNYFSGLHADTVNAQNAHGASYPTGVRIHGTAQRPGLYWCRIWQRTASKRPQGTGNGPGLEFFGGENSLTAIISIRPRGPREGDLVFVSSDKVQHVDNNYFMVVHGDIDARLQEWLESAPPDSPWVYNSETWGQVTGNIHLAGYWMRTVPIKAGIYTHYTWFVVVHDDDHYWRMYASSDHVDIPWTMVASCHDLGLESEVPPKYWSGGGIYVKGAEWYGVEGNGIFSYAGTHTITRESDEGEEITVYQQQPLWTPCPEGWAPYYPPTSQYTSGKLLYEHPTYGWVLVDSIDAEVSAENKVEVLSVAALALPFCPPRANQVKGNSGVARDAVLPVPLITNNTEPESAPAGMTISNIDAATGTSMEFGIFGHQPSITQGIGLPDFSWVGGMLWNNYPMLRMENMERLVMDIEASFSYSCEGNVPGGQGSGTYYYKSFGISGEESLPDTLPCDGPSDLSHGWDREVRTNNSTAAGNMTAQVSLVGISCWSNGYFLHAEGSVPADSFSGGLSGSYGGIDTSQSSSLTWTYCRDPADSPDCEKQVKHRYNSEDLYSKQTDGYGPAGDVHISPISATVSFAINFTLGHGREPTLCPNKGAAMGNAERPVKWVVLGGTLNMNCSWQVQGSSTIYGYFLDQTRTIVTHHTDCDYWCQDRESGSNCSLWYEKIVIPRKENDDPEQLEIATSYSSGVGCDIGLIRWNFSDSDRAILTASHTEEHRHFEQSGTSTRPGPEEATEISKSFSGNCDMHWEETTIPGRTKPGEVPAKYPLNTEQGGYAELYLDGTHSRIDGGEERKAAIYSAWGSYRSAVASGELDKPEEPGYPGRYGYDYVDYAGTRHFSSEKKTANATVTVRRT